MKKIILLALSLVGILALSGCSSYVNSNELEEDDKFVRPHGVHELADFIAQFNGQYTMTTSIDGELSVVMVDGDKRKSTINGVSYYEDLNDERYYFYTQTDDATKHSIYVDRQIETPFDFNDISFSDFEYVEANDTYKLISSKADEFSLEELIVSYDFSNENILFTSVIEGVECASSVVKTGVVDMPNSSELSLYNLDKIEDLLINAGHENYSVETNTSKFTGNGWSETHTTYHTAQYTFFNRYDAVKYNTSYYQLIEYTETDTLLRLTQYPDISAFNYCMTDTFIWLNMFVSTDSRSMYDRLLESSYDEATKSYIYVSDGVEESYTFNDDYTTLTFDDHNVDYFRHIFHDFGTTTTDNFQNYIDNYLSSQTSYGYVNLIK